MLADHSEFFDDEGKQLKPYPPAWIHLSKRFKVGDQIRWLSRYMIHVKGPGCDHGHYNGTKNPGCEDRDLAGQLGVVERIRDGNEERWPSRLTTLDGERFWITQSRGCLVVRFPFGNHYDSAGKLQAICLHPEAEGVDWEPAT